MSARRQNHADARHRLTTEQAIREFYDVLLPDPDPASMAIAQDLCEEYGLKLVDLGKAMALQSFENIYWQQSKGWADGDPSAGQFTIGEAKTPFRVLMRPPKRGEYGWWVKARTPESALAEMLREDALSGLGANTKIGWAAGTEYSDRPDEHDMIAVTCKPEPGYRAAWWSVWERQRGGYLIGLGAAYGGVMWDEGELGVGGIRDPDPYDLEPGELPVSDLDAREMTLRRTLDPHRRAELQRLEALLPARTFRTLKQAERVACEITWRIATTLKEHYAIGSDVVDVISALRHMSAPKPPRAIVNPPGATGSPTSTRPAPQTPGLSRWFIATADGDRMYWAENEEHTREQHWDQHPDEDTYDVWEAGAQLEDKPRANASGNWEVRSTDGGLEGIYAREQEARDYADELRRCGARGVEVRPRRERAPTTSIPSAGRANPSGMTRDAAFMEFRLLLRDPDPAAMDIAKDLALEYKWTLEALSEMGHGNGVYVLSPFNPADAPLYRIEWYVEPCYPQFRGPGAAGKAAYAIGYKFVWHDQDEHLQVANSHTAMRTRAAAQTAAAAMGWALARKLKHLMYEDAAVAESRGGRGYTTDEVRDELAKVLSGLYVDREATELYEQRGTRDAGVAPKKLPTHREAQDHVMAALRRIGWELSIPGHKIPYATSPNGALRLWFRPQAVYYTVVSPAAVVAFGREGRLGVRHSASNARTVSYDLDLRTITPSDFIEQMRQRFPRGFS